MSISSGHKKIAIVGGSFGGINPAYALRRRLGHRPEITLISRDAEFTSAFEARGIKSVSLVEGAHKSTMDELSAWTQSQLWAHDSDGSNKSTMDELSAWTQEADNALVF